MLLIMADKALMQVNKQRDMRRKRLAPNRRIGIVQNII
jgi:hypothetical protein